MLKIDIQCKPSKVFTLFLIFLGLGSVAIVFCLPFAWQYQWILIIIISLYVFDNICHYGMLNRKKSILEIQLFANDDWKLTTRQGAFCAKFHSASMVNSFILVLLFKLENKRLLAVSIIPRKSINEENYRNLLVYLRMKT